MAFIYSELIES